MKANSVGIMTFHWPANYGAVLQAYALQEALKQMAIDVEIIDYVPRRVQVRSYLSDVIHMRFGALHVRLQKGRIISRFKDSITLTSRRFSTFYELQRHLPDYSIIIAGSDQVWNRSFTMGAEGKVTLSYFLSFARSTTRRISYAASFGADKIDKEFASVIMPELKKFRAISVREQSAVELLKKMDFSCELVCDPTMLLEPMHYERFITKKTDHQVYAYLIQGFESSQRTRKQLALPAPQTARVESVEQWLSNIYNSSYVVTDSFHGVVFSILFHRPFMVLCDPASTMNNRMETLLDKFGLEDRIMREFDPDRCRDLLVDTNIDWPSVDIKRSLFVAHSRSYLQRNLMP